MQCIVVGVAACSLTWMMIDPAPGPAAETPLPGQARAVLQTHCARCHGPESPGKGGMNYILDRERLALRKKIVAGDAEHSPLYQRIAEGEMPPEGAKTHPSKTELATIRRWIVAGAPNWEATPARAFVTEGDIACLIHVDIEKIEPRHRRFMRYFSFVHLANANVREPDLETDRHALSKLVNSLSWHPRITLPHAIDAARTIYRIDLRDYQWSASQWNRVTTVYPYVLARRGADFKAIVEATKCEQPFVRADWFVATAAQPPLYHDLLQIPLTDRDLERTLRVDVPLDLQEDRVARSGFNGSGVARNNRLIERHDAAYGAYWRSYDFAENIDRQNLFEHPLGPLPSGNAFQQSGGEIIFNLPNGLQAYMLVDGNGRRLDRAPVEIVSDPKRPDRAVQTGVSCMSCHTQGVMHKADQIRAHVEKNPSVFSKDDTAAVRAQYPREDALKALVDEDAARYRKAVAKTGSPSSDVDPVQTLTQSYEGELSLPAAAAEMGLKPAEFLDRLGHSPTASRLLGALKVPGGTVQRQVFQEAFPEIVRDLKLEVATPAQDAGSASVSARNRPFDGHTGQVLAIAFAPDGKRAISGSEDFTARIWATATGRELRPLEGHTGEVLAVAISPDGKRALTGSMDRTVRLWDLTSGRELQRLEGPTERISSVAFSPDGKRALSGSWDMTVSLWHLESGRELLRLGGHTGYVSAVAFSPNGKHAASASYDHTVRLWNLDTGKEWRILDGSTRELYCVAFSPDGKQLLAGGNDGLVHFWDVKTGHSIKQLSGPGQAVIQVAFSADGSRILAGSSRYRGNGAIVRVWDSATKKPVATFGGRGDTAWGVAFSLDGRQALSATADKTLRRWELAR